MMDDDVEKIYDDACFCLFALRFSSTEEIACVIHRVSPLLQSVRGFSNLQFYGFPDFHISVYDY